MALLARYRLSLAIVLSAVGGVAGILAFARPGLRAGAESEMFELADVDHHTPAEVRAAFAKHGLRLRYDNAPAEPLWLSTQPGPWTTAAFYVVHVSQRSGRMSWGPEPDGDWEARRGNVLVHYGGGDETLLTRIQAAAAELGG